jgi:hypothetical protein
MSNYSNTPITYMPTNTGYRLLIADNSSNGNRNNTNVNINYRHTDTAGRELNMDADYGSYRLNNNQLQPNYYYNFSGSNELERRVYNMIAPSKIDIATFKTDYEQPFAKGNWELEENLAW